MGDVRAVGVNLHGENIQRSASIKELKTFCSCLFSFPWWPIHLGSAGNSPVEKWEGCGPPEGTQMLESTQHIGNVVRIFFFPEIVVLQPSTEPICSLRWRSSDDDKYSRTVCGEPLWVRWRLMMATLAKLVAKAITGTKWKISAFPFQAYQYQVVPVLLKVPGAWLSACDG